MRSYFIFATIFISFQILDSHGANTNSRLNFFDIDLLRATAEDKQGNVMISPASIKSSLAMLLEGANGATATEIKSALRVSPVKEDFREELHTFLKALEANSHGVILNNANALFVSNKLKLKKDYETVVQRSYFAKVDKLDFGNSKSSVETINAWVHGKTQGLIPSIIEESQVSPTTEMVITNALYFKAPWKYSFNAKTTHSDCFYRDGICKNVAMMDLQAELKYAFVSNLRAHALDLPYQDDRYSMILLVPQDREAGVALIRDLPYIGLPQVIDMMESNEVTLTLPKFDIEYSENLVGALRNLRIKSLFSKSANLSGIFDHDEDAYLNSIYHSVHMKVDEVGTVAAAATASMVVPLINNQVQLRVDRPFLFFIRDNELGVTLFEGKIEDPTEFVDPAKVSGSTQANMPSATTQTFNSQSAQNQAPSPRQPSNPVILQSNFHQDASNQQTFHTNEQIHSPYENIPSQTANVKPTVSTVSENTKRKGIITWFKGFFD